VEKLRKFINAETDQRDPRDTRAAVQLKRLIDAQTEGAGGDVFKQARAARARYAQQFENVGLVERLMKAKPGSTDRRIALEQVVDSSVLSPTTDLDSLRHLGRLLKSSGAEGQRAWRNLQGATLESIRDRALQFGSIDEQGNRILSLDKFRRSLAALDKSGKLDYLFGKKGAEQLRTLQAVAEDALTFPPGSVNTSNTSSALLRAADTLVTYGFTGLPVAGREVFALLAKYASDRKTKARVRKALE
jgi:hypothetical protein